MRSVIVKGESTVNFQQYEDVLKLKGWALLNETRRKAEYFRLSSRKRSQDYNRIIPHSKHEEAVERNFNLKELALCQQLLHWGLM